MTRTARQKFLETGLIFRNGTYMTEAEWESVRPETGTERFYRLAAEKEAFLTAMKTPVAKMTKAQLVQMLGVRGIDISDPDGFTVAQLREQMAPDPVAT